MPEKTATPAPDATHPTRPKSKLSTILLLSAVLFVLFRAFGVSDRRPPLSPGDPAPDFALTDLDGNALRLADFRGRVVVLDFWATWCPPCVGQMPVLNDLAIALAPRGVTVIGVNIESGEDETVRGFVRKNALTFPIAVDTGTVANAYRVSTYPTTFLIGRTGAIRAVFRGAPRPATLRDAVETLLKERDS